MKQSDIRLHDLVRELLFVDTPDLYPDFFWTDFWDALSVFLCDEDLAAIESRYGKETNTNNQVRRQLVEISTYLRDISLVDEIYDLIDKYDKESENDDVNENNSENDDVNENNSEIELILASHKLNYKPFEINNIKFSTLVGNRPVFVWKYEDVPMPLAFLHKILGGLAECDYDDLILISRSDMLSEIPRDYQFPTEYDVLPIHKDNILDVETQTPSKWIS